MGTHIAPRDHDKKQLVDVGMVGQAFKTLVEPGQVVEIRVLDALTADSPKFSYTASGYFDNLEALQKALTRIQKAKGIYITLQPCKPALLARANNRLRSAQDMKSNKTTTSDEQILRYRWLPIDADPVRPAGISSSIEEHQAALTVAQTILETLRAEGWPEPVRGNSGNGAHLLYPIDLENTPEHTTLVQQVLQGLAKRFNTDDVTIDLTVFNPARIWKLYGTLACKGDDTPDRPHRLAEIIEAPGRSTIVSPDQLHAIADKTEPKQENKHSPQAVAPSTRFSLDDFLSKHGIPARPAEPYRNGIKRMLEQCPFCQEEDKSACVYELADGSLGFSCSHNRCADRHWHDFREHFEPGYSLTRQIKQTPLDLPEEEMNQNITTGFVQECLEMGEYGDGLLFARVFRGKTLFDHTASEWYIWQEHYWLCDDTGRIKHYVSGKLASIYLRAGAALNEQERNIDSETEEGKERLQRLKKAIGQLTKRALDLRYIGRCRNVLTYAASEPGMGIMAKQWDTHHWLLGTSRGVIDLKRGELRPGQSEDYIRTIAPTIWRGLNAPAPRWKRCLEEMFEDRAPEERAALIGFIQRLLGYGLLGEVDDHVFAVFYGEGGRNGKDTIQHILNHTLGDMSTSVHNDVLLATDRGHSAGSATPHISDLQGKRLAWASEPEEGARFSTGQVKLLTGGGDISTRGLYEKKQYKFEPSHLLLLLTNHKPHADANDSAFWERLRLITFNMRFIDNPKEENERKKEPGLWDTLASEASGILAWLVRGCLEWQRIGLDTPEAVLTDGLQYRKSEDPIIQFVAECCVVKTGLKCKAGDLYKRYDSWAKDGNIKPILNSTMFGRLMAKRFKKEKEGVMMYYGVALSLVDSLLPDLDSSGGFETTIQNGTEQPEELTQSNRLDNQIGQFGGFSQQGAPIRENNSSKTQVSAKTIQTIQPNQTTSDINEPVKPANQTLEGSENYPEEEYSEVI